MEFKNAITVCLISFFSATLVVLIARSLDSQAASQLKPELAKISAELQALRAQLAGVQITATGEGGAGGILPAASEINDGLIVYYAHSNTRCPDCESMEREAQKALGTGFADELSEGKIAWKVVNYEEPEGAFLVSDYGVLMPTVVLIRMGNGEIIEGKMLDEAFALIKGPHEKYTEYIQENVRTMLRETTDSSATSEDDSANDPSDATLDIPLPTL